MAICVHKGFEREREKERISLFRFANEGKCREGSSIVGCEERERGGERERENGEVVSRENGFFLSCYVDENE